MQEIKPTYISFEQAKLLKEKGFDIPTVKFYYLHDNRKWHQDGELGEGFNDDYWGDNTNLNWNKDGRLPFKPFSDCVSAPEQHTIVEWLRITHGIWIQIFPIGENKEMKYYCKIIKNDNGWVKIVHQISTIVITPQEAYSSAFDYVLKELI